MGGSLQIFVPHPRRSRAFQPRISRKVRAFTIVEVLVVLAVIALLFALLIPSLSQARFIAKVTSCLNNHRQLFIATTAYAADYRNKLPETNYWQSWRGMFYFGMGHTITDPTIRSQFWGVGTLVGHHYLSPSSVFTCPDYKVMHVMDWSDVNAGGQFRLAQQLQVNPMMDITGPYVMNTQPYYDPAPTNLSRGVLGEPGRDGAYWGPDNTWYGRVNHITSLMQCFTGQFQQPYYEGGSHQKLGMNCTYIDGHARWLPYDASDLTGRWLGADFWNFGNSCTHTGAGWWPWATAKDRP